MNSDNGNHAHHKATPRMATRIRRDRYGLFAIVEVTMPDRKKALTTMRPDVTPGSSSTTTSSSPGPPASANHSSPVPSSSALAGAALTPTMCPKPGEPNADIVEYNSCVSYLQGVADAERDLTSWGSIEQPLFCMATAGGTSGEQLRLVFLPYMKERPEDWHFNAGGLVLSAFAEAWPCTPTEEEKAVNRTLQSCLAFLGYYKGEVDGLWGPKSESAWTTAGESMAVVQTCLENGWTSPE